MRIRLRLCVLLVAATVTAGCATDAAMGGRVAAPAVALATYERHVATLAADEFEGRKPGTPGEKKTLDYLVAEYRRLGLQPVDGRDFLQPVPMVEITAGSSTSLSFTAGGARTDLEYTRDMVIGTRRVKTEESLTASPLVFVGYGVTAPEYGWDDYAGLDMRGKTAVILVNDPGFESGDPALFRGRAMTYYGRWTYKFEEASRRGAAAALIVHETAPAAYPWQTVVNSWSGPQLDAETADGNAGRVAIEGWITREAAEKLLASLPGGFEGAKRRANTRGFRPEPLDATADALVRNAIRRGKSYNVVGVLPGTRRPDEHVIYMAHWDHLGKAFGRDGDLIFNGAEDNATGVAGMLAIAEAFSQARRRPERSVMFLALTLEESGLLGSAWYVDQPLVPLTRTVATINADMIEFGGPRRDISVIGYGASELEGYLARAAARRDMTIVPEPTPESGLYFRSDHFNFAKYGVPSLYVKLGMDDIEKGREFGLAENTRYYAERYHKPGDEYRPGLDLRGGAELMNVLYDVGAKIAREKTWPNWNRDSEFRAIRDRSLKEESK